MAKLQSPKSELSFKWRPNEKMNELWQLRNGPFPGLILIHILINFKGIRDG